MYQHIVLFSLRTSPQIVRGWHDKTILCSTRIPRVESCSTLILNCSSLYWGMYTHTSFLVEDVHKEVLSRNFYEVWQILSLILGKISNAVSDLGNLAMLSSSRACNITIIPSYVPSFHLSKQKDLVATAQTLKRWTDENSF